MTPYYISSMESRRESFYGKFELKSEIAQQFGTTHCPEPADFAEVPSIWKAIVHNHGCEPRPKMEGRNNAGREYVP